MKPGKGRGQPKEEPGVIRWRKVLLFTPHAPHPVFLGGPSQSVLVSVCAWRGQRRNNLNSELCLQGPRALRNKTFGFSLHTLKLTLCDVQFSWF